MGYGMIKSGINKSVSLESQRAGNSAGVRNLALAGALVSATNPYFILWWASTV
jgi:threonine/homoserine/homoserine lactone efflux protein